METHTLPDVTDTRDTTPDHTIKHAALVRIGWNGNDEFDIGNRGHGLAQSTIYR